jgi:hypothetical protein
MNYNGSTDDTNTEEAKTMTIEKDDSSNLESYNDSFEIHSDNYDSNENECRYEGFSLFFLN